MYTRVDVTEVAAAAEGAKPRTLMGFKLLSFVCTQTFAWSEEIIVGDHLESSNPFYWDKVILNLLGTSKYDPTMPTVYRWNSRKKRMACFFGTYIDDIRTGGPTEVACKITSRRVALRMNFLDQLPWSAGRCEKERTTGQTTKSMGRRKMLLNGRKRLVCFYHPGKEVEGQNHGG